MRRLMILLIGFVLTMPLPTLAVELFGYFETQLTGARLKNQTIQLQTNKLRIDLADDISDEVTFGANFDYITYHGQTEYNVLDYIPEKIAASVPDLLKPYYSLQMGDIATMNGPVPMLRPERIFLDNAYLKIRLSRFDLTLGKQQISMGTGYVWNPTDLFNNKDVFDPTYEQQGHNAIRLDLNLAARINISAIYTPENDWKNSGKLIKLKSGLGHFDFSLLAARRNWTFTHFLPPETVSARWFPEAVSEKRAVFGGDLVGQLLGCGVWLEASYNKMEQTQNFTELVVGADYTFDSQTYVMFEYYRNELGKTNFDEYNLDDWMQYLLTEKKAISQEQLYSMIQHPLTDLINVGISVIYSISDQSLALLPTVNYSIFQNVELFGYLNLYFGESGKNFSKDYGNGGLVRIRVYF